MQLHGSAWEGAVKIRHGSSSLPTVALPHYSLQPLSLFTSDLPAGVTLPWPHLVNILMPHGEGECEAQRQLFVFHLVFIQEVGDAFRDVIEELEKGGPKSFQNHDNSIAGHFPSALQPPTSSCL